LDAARRAIIASLPLVKVASGIWIEVSGETGQKRGERPVSRPRGELVIVAAIIIVLVFVNG